MNIQDELLEAGSTKINELIGEKRDLLTVLQSITIMVGEMEDLTVDQHEPFAMARGLLSEHGLDV